MKKVPATQSHHASIHPPSGISHTKSDEKATTADRLLDIAEAAAYLATTERHVRYLYETRALAAVKIGKKVRFRRQDLDEYIVAHRVERLR